MKPQALVLALLASIAVTATGCGTLMGDRRAAVNLTSNPPGAEVYVDGVRMGVTPLDVSVTTRGSHAIELRHAGRTARCTIAGSVSGMWIAFDILFGLVPLAVDAATGGWHGLDYDGCHARFPAQVAARTP
ncbi:MAG: PEGA domain-containing protein [Deltaproteobacteria bacterium]|nr:PEGA domain-containing protein [Deltaproteobacteria bacterium]